MDLPRNGTQLTDDLREVLRVAAPHVPVGHSLGGLHARLHEAVPRRGRRPRRQVLARAAGRHAAGVPGQVRPGARRVARRDPRPLLDRGYGREAFRQSLREPMNLPRLFGEVRAAGPDPDVPMAFVSAMGVDTFTEELAPPEARASLAESDRTKHRLYTDLAAALPRAEARRVDGAGHSDLAWLRPDAVVQAIRDTPSRG
ncbi:alpha/beta fold hydrolase [Amycolatopsis mongoliensis]|uniref:Alpha/beta fold hydrolase n=1 Tax=Amycolatopsis mongoliensis TaxID=715475 RepID=A0A9Y2JNW4_9PSEU|nr:alpha/beta fold hydrolase [Amycolatopsis sp. 4-36]WIY01963.1 alpha/beta fold hydrolase [Amycolatopsis sp. 4-36]